MADERADNHPAPDRPATAGQDTIVALATPLGVSGLGVVRLSGERAVAIADAMFRPTDGSRLAEAESHRLLHGWLYEAGGEEGTGGGKAELNDVLDEAMAAVMRTPRSYTREDVVELQCHGSPMILRTVVEQACLLGARPARPGEFTLRAFLNGRIDLTRAEAVGDIVHSRSRMALTAGVNQLRGRLYQAIETLRDEVARIAALVNAGIDFPEEDVVFTRQGELLERIGAVTAQVDRLVATAGRGRIIREGLGLALVGRPNVGKSSLLNALLRENRAIVTEVPGTTRDTLEEMAELGGLAVRLVDTAGIRESADTVESIGIGRAREAMAKAELVLLVLDGAAPLTPEDQSLLELMRPESALVVVNKGDLLPEGTPRWEEPLPEALAALEQVVISAREGTGLEALETAIVGRALRGEIPRSEEALITNLRQEDAARRAREALQEARAALEEGRGEELLAVDLARALFALGEIVGLTAADDLLGRIFADFCIGK